MTSQTILIVEDDPFLRETMGEALREHDVIVDQTSNGEEAIEYLKSHTPDLLLLDLLMPRKDGYAVLHHLKEVNSSLPVLILSNLSDYLDHEKCLKLGARDYLIKSDMDADDLWPKIQPYLS